MAVSITAKILGIVGTGMLAVSFVGLYVSWDYITDSHLFSMEKKLLSKDVVLEINDVEDEENDNTIVATVNTASKSNLGGGNSWKCKIKVNANNDLENEKDSVKAKVKTALADINDPQDDLIKLSKRRWFVKNCAKHRLINTTEANIVSKVEVKATKIGNEWSVYVGNLLNGFIGEIKK